MTDKPRMRLELHLISEATNERYAQAVRLEDDEAVDRWEHSLGKLKPPSELDTRTFEETIQAMQRREFRRSAIVSQAKTLGDALCDLLEDREGWHGADRQERTTQ